MPKGAVMQQMKIQLIKHIVLSLLSVACLAGALEADWRYSDNFATNKAEGDSYFHSPFWTMEATPLPEPYLYYMETGAGRGLVFVEYGDRPAELAYAFPLVSVQAGAATGGVLSVEVSFPCNALVSQYPQGRLTYSVSPDGLAWSSEEPLTAGRHDIPLSSATGTCYILFAGARAMIENLEVSLSPQAATIYVPKDFRTIQEALDFAKDGDVVEVQAGAYSGSGNWDLDFGGKRITLRSKSGPERTIIDCSKGTAAGAASHRGFYFHGREGADSVLSGFTIRGGRAFGSQVPTNTLRWDAASSHPIGGGIYCEFSSPTITDCIIEDCGAEVGGGIGCVGASPVIADCVINWCSAGGFGPAESGGRGGAVGLIDSDVTLSHCTLQDNTAYYNSFGAGLYCLDSTATVSGCAIVSNTAPGSVQGGGAYCVGDTTNVTFTNCVIAGNQADTGGGIFTESPGWFPRCRVAVRNCTIVSNRITGSWWTSGTAIYSMGTDIVVTNSIVWSNSGTAIVIDKAVAPEPVTYCDVEYGYPGRGNIDEDPRFNTTVDWDYYLKSSFGRYDPRFNRWVYDTVHSPCIDAGDPQTSVGAEPLPNGGRINMGAHGGTPQASKGTETHVYHVDGASGRDWNNGLSKNRAFASIQEAIDTAQSGDTILVWPGVYSEPLTVMGKAITIRSAADAAVIMAPGDIGVSFYYAESSNSVLANFVITGCSSEQGALFCSGASPTLKNLTIVGNRFGVTAYDGAEPHVVNCILWGNRDGDLFQDGGLFQGGDLVRYSCVEKGTPKSTAGNIRVDPQFSDPENGDYHLKSRYGRYVPQDDAWVTDNVQSLCIDAGDPDDDPRSERTPNGTVVNMGAYGGTASASLSSWPRCD